MKKIQHLLSLWICLFSFFTLGLSQNCVIVGNTITVNNTNDEGSGSFREAINCANALSGPNEIVFDIPGAGPHIINVGSTSNFSLPILIDDSTSIDARTQAGYQGVPVIILDGSEGTWFNPINALYVQGDVCEIYGLEIRNFPDDGIDFRGSDNGIIRANYIHDNGYEQDFFPGAPGTGPWNGCGIVIRSGSDNNQIDGNVIENNEYCGIIVRSTVAQNTIGGQVPNVIRDNAAGIYIGSTASSIKLQQNELICNDTIGIYLEPGANAGVLPPVVSTTTTNLVAGTGTNGNVIEVYISDNSTCAEAVCQGSIYLGSTVVENGTWQLDGPFVNNTVLNSGDIVTATATNLLQNTSAYAECMVVTGVSACTDENGDIYVTNTNDVGQGSLRAAIECANETPGANTIRFAIPGDGVHTIFVGEDNDQALPALTDEGTILDATTQAGFGEDEDYSPKIRLDGSQTDWTGPYNAVWVRGDYCEVYGLEIRNFPDDGIDVTAADHVIVGAVNKGNVLYDNGYEQDFFPDAPGTGPWNGCGIVYKLGSSYGVIEGNYLGTNVSESISASNELCGIIIANGGDHNQVKNNVIAYHEQGLRITSGGWYNTISQNSFYCNDSIAIGLSGSANLIPNTPVIDSASTNYISGRADSADIIEVYIAADGDCAIGPCQGKIYLGAAVTTDSVWVLEAPFVNGITLVDTNKVTTTATDITGNTSAFSFCKAVTADIICDLSVSVQNVNTANCGLHNGGFEVVLTNGTAPFTIDIGTGPSSQLQYNELPAGDYSIEVSDVNGCTATTDITIVNSALVEIESVMTSDANCNEINGSLTITAVGGQAPYTYDIGSGASFDNVFSGLPAGEYTITVTDANGCEDIAEAILTQSGAASAVVLETLTATCGLANGAVLFEASGGVPPYTFDIGDGPTNSPSIDNIAGGIYFLSLTDAMGCISEEVFFIENEGVFPVSEFSYLDVDAVVDFSSAATGGETYHWDFGDGTTSALENPTHTFPASGDYNVCLEVSNECGMDVSCELISILIPLANINVGGTIAKENGQTVALVEVLEENHSVQVTQDNGTYIYPDETPLSDYTITPIKDINYSNGVSTFDQFQIMQHILFVQPLDSPYKIIAADIDANGTVSTFDLIRLRQVILQNVDTFPNNTSWRFIPEFYSFADPTDPLSENFPESITLSNVSEDKLNEDFVAIKVGDVNLSANPNNLTNPEGESQLSLEIEESHSDDILLRVHVRQAAELSAFEGSFWIDPHYLSIDAVMPGSHSAPDVAFRNNTVLNFAWYAKEGRALEDYFFYLRLRPQTKDWWKGLSMGNTIPGFSYDEFGSAYRLSLEFDLAEDNSALEVAPNPFLDQTRLTVFLDEATTLGEERAQRMELKIFDLQGKEIYQKAVELEAGQNVIELDLSAFAAGAYLYTLGKWQGTLLKE